MEPLRSQQGIVSLLALLASVGPISTDMYLPAFPAMQAGLHASAGSAQLTLAAWFLGLSAGQITHGPLSDHFGRRLPLLVGTLIYAIASMGCALAPDMMVLSLFRAAAAFGGAASMVVPRAVIRDIVTDDVQAARMVSWQATVMGVVPVLAPSLGSVIAGSAGWRAIFWFAAVYGVTCTVLIWRLLPDTLPRHLRISANFTPVMIRYLRIVRETTFLTHALEGGLATFALFAFLGGAPPVFMSAFHTTPLEFGTVFIVNAAAYVAGTRANARLIRTLPRWRLLRAGTLGLLVGTLLMLVCAITGAFSVWGVVVPMGLVMASLGVVLPDAMIGAVMPHTRDAGSASALYGTIIFFIGAAGTITVGMMYDGTARPMAALMLLGALCAAGVNLTRPGVVTLRKPLFTEPGV